MPKLQHRSQALASPPTHLIFFCLHRAQAVALGRRGSRGFCCLSSGAGHKHSRLPLQHWLQVGFCSSHLTWRSVSSRMVDYMSMLQMKTHPPISARVATGTCPLDRRLLGRVSDRSEIRLLITLRERGGKGGALGRYGPGPLLAWFVTHGCLVLRNSKNIIDGSEATVRNHAARYTTSDESLLTYP